MVVEIIRNRAIGITRTGAGSPMFMLHCTLANRRALKGLQAHLEGFAFTAVDLPGHGESQYEAQADIQQQAIETAISLLETSGPAHLLGHSFGATIALNLALQRPDLVRSLSLFEPVYFSILAQADPQAYQAELTAALPFANAAKQGDWPQAARAFLQRWSLESFDALSPSAQKNIVKLIPLAYVVEPSIIAPASGAKIYAALKDLDTPVLLLEGSESPPSIGAINNVIETEVPDVRRYTISGAGHMGLITHSQEAAQLIAAFAKSATK